MSFTLIRMLHLLAALILGMAILVTQLGFSRELSLDDRRSLNRMLLVQFIAAIAVALAGMALWLATGRPSDIYMGNPLFHAKLSLFLVMLLLSLPAAVYLKRAATLEGTARVPRPVIFALRLQLILLLCIPALAWMIARGIGY
ncbi:MAG: DUF2214 family protein [Pseudomonadota bacterium]